MSIKVAQNYFTGKRIDFDTFTKMAKELWFLPHIRALGDVAKLIVAKGFKNLSNKSPNLVTLISVYVTLYIGGRHSSVVWSALTILQPRVRIPSTPSMLYSIYCVIIETLFDVGMKKGQE